MTDDQLSIARWAFDTRVPCEYERARLVMLLVAIDCYQISHSFEV